MNDSELTHKGPCTDCGSSDACAHYTDGHTHCFSCGAHTLATLTDADTQRQHRATPASLFSFGANEGRYEALMARKIDEATCRKHGYWVGRNRDGQMVQVADYRDSTGQLIGQKIRGRDKVFQSLQDKSASLKLRDALWGSHLWSGGGRMITITEGEIDCLTVSQLQGCKWPVVSLSSGASAAAKTCAANYDYLDGYEKIVLMFDMDEPGRLAAQQAAEVLPPGKVFIAQLPLKDANECLLYGKSQAVIDAMWNATPYMPDGVHAAKSLIDRTLEKMSNPEATAFNFPCGVLLNDKTLGMRLGEVVTITSGSGMGKSSFVREIAYDIGHRLKHRVGMAFLEESVEETLTDITGLHLNKRIRQFPDSATIEEKTAALKEVFGGDQYFLYDHFGSAAEDSLLGKLRYMANVEDCSLLIVDHLSIIVSGMEAGEDERKTIDRIMTKLKTLAKTLNVVIMVVVHLRRKDNKSKSHEEGGKVTLGELRGSGAIAQLSDTVIGLERNQQGDMPNLVTIRILKSRFTGDTGTAGALLYNKETGRLEDTDFNDGDSEEDEGHDTSF